MFTLQNTKQEFLQLSERKMELMESHASVAKFDLSLFASGDGRRIITNL